MLGKLFKYENRAISKILMPLSIAVILLSLFGALLLKSNFLFESFYSQESLFSEAIMGGSTLLIIGSIVAIISANFIAVYLIMQRYYKNLFTDEGYLTFTLPVKQSQIILSKLFTGVIWTIIIALCTLAGVAIFVLFGTSASFINYEVIDMISYAWEQLTAYYSASLGNFFIMVIEVIVICLVSMVTSYLLIYLSITLGSQLAKKHKVLASIGMYFVISSIAETIELISTTVLSGLFLDGMYIESEILTLSQMHILFIFSVVFNLIASAVYFIVNKHILTNKLNIE